MTNSLAKVVKCVWRSIAFIEDSFEVRPEMRSCDMTMNERRENWLPSIHRIAIVDWNPDRNIPMCKHEDNSSMWIEWVRRMSTGRKDSTMADDDNSWMLQSSSILEERWSTIDALSFDDCPENIHRDLHRTDLCRQENDAGSILPTYSKDKITTNHRDWRLNEWTEAFDRIERGRDKWDSSWSVGFGCEESRRS